MAKAVWTGSLSFGLVNIPVRLFNATTPKDVRFRQFQQGTGKRIRYRRVTEPAPEAYGQWGSAISKHADTDGLGPVGPPEPDTESPAPPAPSRTVQPEPSNTRLPSETEVPYQEIVKGFEIDRDRYVMVSPEELRALEPERSQSIEIEGFVDLSEVDPIYFEKSYYVAPQRGVGAEKPYALLHRALQRANRAGIARFVMRTREYLAAIRAMPEIVVLETLFFADEVRSVAEIDNVPKNTTAEERELAMAMQFMELLGMAWEPARYQDSYRERVLELLRARAEQEGAVTEAPGFAAPEPSAVPDLMAALRASVEAAKERRDDAAESPTEPRRPRRRTG